MCRNVLIYFDRPTQERLVSQFIDALHPGGFLVLGRAETLSGGIRTRLHLEDARNEADDVVFFQIDIGDADFDVDLVKCPSNRLGCRGSPVLLLARRET